jgi:hypothetical protein
MGEGLIYCQMDTLATVRIVEKLRELAGSEFMLRGRG